LFLAGCQTTEERLAADDYRCQSYGLKKGDPAYAQCRMNLDTNRANVTASERFGAGGGIVGAVKRATE
jgi:hypothetical protein